MDHAINEEMSNIIMKNFSRPKGPRIALKSYMKKREENKQKGTIKFFDTTKGYGFIKCDSSDLFFHITEFRDMREPQSGDVVAFDMSENDKGKIAKNIVFVQGAD